MGKTIAAKNTAEVSRAITGLTREKRQLKLVQKEWKAANDHASALRQQIKQLEMQDAELNIQLARVAGDTTANNRLVGLINAGRTKSKLLADQVEQATEIVAKRRSNLSEAESLYAETVLAIRKDFNKIQAQLVEDLKKGPTKIALGVMQQNFACPKPADLTASKILAPLAKRIERLEQEVFSESVKLDVSPNGSMYVDVAIGNKSCRMVVDSGATLICLPFQLAKELGISVPQ